VTRLSNPDQKQYQTIQPGEAMVNKLKLPFTVIATVDGTGEIKSFKVEAVDAMKAFSVVARANKDEQLDFVVAISGHLDEDKGLTFPGEGVVCIETVLEQRDVF
jgi:hypothetical protein